jgi:gliding motility-associated-like protein
MNTLFFNSRYFVIICFVVNLFTYNIDAQPALSVGFASVTTNLQYIYIIALPTDGIQAQQYVFYRADKNSNDYKEIGISTTNSFTDKNVDAKKQAYCYQIAYVDNLGKKSALSSPFCSILLSSNSTNVIEWTGFSPLPNAQAVEYFVDIINNDGSINRNSSYKTTKLSANINDIDGISQELDDFDQATVRIRAIQKTTFVLRGQLLTDFPLEIYSNSFVINPPPSIHLPTVFTPDENGDNDIFLAKGKNIVTFSMTIFNKWANVVFESTDIDKGWNGMLTDQSTQSPLGNYAYKIMVKDKFNRVVEKNGVVLLVR